MQGGPRTARRAVNLLSGIGPGTARRAVNLVSGIGPGTARRVVNLVSGIWDLKQLGEQSIYYHVNRT